MRPSRLLRAAALLLAAAAAPPLVSAQTPLLLWGHGVKPCSDLVAVAPRGEAPAPMADPAYLLYREWLAGLVTGLNLATGRDLLGGAELDAALARVRDTCERFPEDDVFNASLRFIRSLGRLDGG